MDVKSAYTLERGVKLLDLPTAGDVAQLLRAAGARQRKGSLSCNCPVAVFLEAFVGQPVDVIADAAKLQSDLWDVGRSVKMPPAANEFVRCFDNGDLQFADLKLRSRS